VRTEKQGVGSVAGGRRARRVAALALGLCATATTVVLASNVPVIAQVVDPTTTTTPPDTTTTLPPDTTTTLPPDTTTTAAPAPGPEPDPDLAFLNGLLAQVGKLAPGEALVSRPEFASLSGHQRDLVQQLQTATDAFAIRRFALYGFTNQVTAAKLALKNARAAENEAILREIIGLADAAHSVDHTEESASAVSLVGIPDISRPSNAVDDQVAAFNALRRRLAADRKDAHAERLRAQDALATTNDNLANLTKTTADALNERNAAESAIENELGSDAVRARPDGITATLAAAQAGQGDPSGPSDLQFPIPGAPLVSPFGLRNDPLSNGAGFHPGVDFGASSGTPIRAAGAGVVVIAGDCGGYGFCVVIDHGNSTATLYGHQSQLAVSPGQHVDAGQVIGYVGSTGASTGPHLHFEVREHGVPIDPVLALLTNES